MEESSGQEHTKEGVEIFFQRMGQLFGQNPPQDATVPVTKAEDEYQRDQEREQRERKKRIRAKLRKQLESGTLDDQFVEVEVEESSMTMWQGFSPQGMEEMVFDMRDMLGSSLPKRRRTKRARISEAKKILAHEEAQKMIDRDDINRIAQQRAQEHGIIFIDEIDKVVAKGSGGSGPDVSREGVQRDLLPVIEGSTVFTKYGSIDTRHILFIAAGAFHNAKPSDLIPELQGRLPIRVELQQLTEEDFAQILLEPKSSLIKQYQALLRTEGVELEFTEDAIGEIARLAAEVNAQTENIGARRLHTMLERLLEEISFGAPDKMTGPVRIDAAYVRSRLADAAGSQDLSRYIL
jgi:ATP-dependent HslUV protease ATP-binding subunit HslU